MKKDNAIVEEAQAILSSDIIEEARNDGELDSDFINHCKSASFSLDVIYKFFKNTKYQSKIDDIIGILDQVIAHEAGHEEFARVQREAELRELYGR
jgi:hypothetical protein